MRVKKRYILIKKSKEKDTQLNNYLNDRRIRVISKGKTTRAIEKANSFSNSKEQEEKKEHHLLISCKLESLKDVIVLLNQKGIQVVTVSGSMKSIRSRFNNISSRSSG